MSQNTTENTKKQQGTGRNKNQDSSQQRKISTFVSRIENLAIGNEEEAATSPTSNVNNRTAVNFGMTLRSNKATEMAANEELSLQDVKTWMDTKFTAIIQQNEETKTQINALVGRTEKTEADVFDLKLKSDKLERENKALQDKLEKTIDKVLIQEAQQKKTNLRFYNVAENTGDNPKALIIKYIGEVLGLLTENNEGVTDAFRVGARPQPGDQKDRRPRPIIVRFTSTQEATRVKLAAWKIGKRTPSDVAVGEDLPQEWAQLRSRAYKTIVKPAKNEGKTVRWRGAKCYIDGALVAIPAE